MGKIVGTPQEPNCSSIYRGFLLGLPLSVTQSIISSVRYEYRTSPDDSFNTDWQDLAIAYKATNFQFIHDTLYTDVYYQYRYLVYYTDGTISAWSDYVIAGAGTIETQDYSSLDQIASSLGTITSGFLRGVIFETSANYPKIRMDPTGFYSITTTSTPIFLSASGSAYFQGTLFPQGINFEQGLSSWQRFLSTQTPGVPVNSVASDTIAWLSIAESDFATPKALIYSTTHETQFLTTNVFTFESRGNSVVQLKAVENEADDIGSILTVSGPNTVLPYLDYVPSAVAINIYASTPIYSNQSLTLLDETGFSNFLIHDSSDRSKITFGSTPIMWKGTSTVEGFIEYLSTTGTSTPVFASVSFDTTGASRKDLIASVQNVGGTAMKITGATGSGTVFTGTTTCYWAVLG